jgi:hypothetical protein
MMVVEEILEQTFCKRVSCSSRLFTDAFFFPVSFLLFSFFLSFLLCSFSESVGLSTREKYHHLDEKTIATKLVTALSTDMRRDTTQIYPGSIFGLEHYFSKRGSVALDSILVRVIAFLSV